MPSFPNKLGRSPGRGLRPWLLIPKYLLVSLLLGGLASTTILALVASGWSHADQAPVREMIRWIFRFQIIPAALAAVCLGLLLLLQHPREFLRMRWLRVKLPALAIILPGSHLALRWMIDHQLGMAPLYKTLAASLLSFLAIASLSRLKPRLGTRYQ